VQTTGQGDYTFAGVTPGKYKLAVEKGGFGKSESTFPITVAQRLTRDVTLKAGGEATTVEVVSGEEVINTASPEVSTVVTSQQLQQLPLLTKNPYALIGLSGGAVDTSSSSGDIRGQGFAVNGQRTSSVNYLLDGVENNETFATGPAALVPNDSVQEFKVQANNMTAEFGRNAVNTNVVTKSGTNSFHGSLSEYYRGAALTANTVDNKARDLPKSNFVRNDFTATVGGPVIKDRTFFFAALEGLRVRSSSVVQWWVPTQQFLSASTPAMTAYINAGGGLPASNPSNCITADQFAALNGVGPLTTATGGALPGTTPLFCQTETNPPIDAGGGLAQNTWNAIGKLDHRFTDRTNASFRYAFTNNEFFPGFSGGSDSPFPGFRTGGSFRTENYAATLTHAFSNALVSENKLAFSRTNPQAPLGSGDVNVPCLFFSNNTGTPDSAPIAFPGYLPNLCGAFSLPSGGPQNTSSANSGWTLSRGNHQFKWGAYMSHLRDNHTFGALSNALALVSDPQNLINGQIDTLFAVAADPKGHTAGDFYNQAVDGPFVAPSFTRHYRYNEFAFYGEDSWRITPRFTATIGLRWEYFGVLHSPDAEKFLDANFYLDSVGVPKALDPSKTLAEQIRDGRFSRTNNFFNQDWNNFGPRVGFAWDVFGNGKTALRGGYGIFYDKNFGNALFNAIQNFPNYAGVQVFGDGITPLGSIDANQYTNLGNLLGTGDVRLTGSGRMLNRNMVTAYSQQWNAALEHDWGGRGIVTSLTYVGTKGDKLYSLNNLNMRGSCSVAPAATYGLPCTGLERLNQSGVTGLNRRGNEGFARYHGVTAEIRTRAWHGFTLLTNYTYSQSKDNGSSFFGDSAWVAAMPFGFGFRNPFDPAIDYAFSDNDIKHRYVLSYNWDVPVPAGWTGTAKAILGGWSVSGIYNVQSGAPISVWDIKGGTGNCKLSATNFCYPVVIGATPEMQKTFDNTPGAFNTYTLYDLTGYVQHQSDFCATQPDPVACSNDLIFGPGAANLEVQRNSLRLPGFWNWDAAVAKRFALPREGMGLELRAEFFNVLNHSNLYANPGTNDIANGQIKANYGTRPGIGAAGVAADRRAIQVGAKFTF
jgi:hypothetical protein